MERFLAIAKALSDESRVRILLGLRQGELCLCQMIDLLGLAPATVSKHVDVLRQAGLVSLRKSGRWHYYGLAGEDAPPMVRRALQWVAESLQGEKVVMSDAARVCCVRETDPKELTICYGRK